jgi:hypothetical protein
VVDARLAAKTSPLVCTLALRVCDCPTAIACSYRAKHNAPALSWDPKLAAVAQAWAESCPAGLSDNPYGENMAWGYGSFIDATEAWYSEVRTLLPHISTFCHVNCMLTHLVCVFYT